MTYDDAVALLPPVYARALQLHDEGWDKRRIARELAVDPAAIGPMLHLAQAKLTRLMQLERDADTPAEPPQPDGANSGAS